MARRVGNGMGCLDDLDMAAVYAVTVAGDDEPLDGTRPVVLDRLGHGRRSLAGSQNDRAALGRRRQVLRHDLVGQRRIDRRIEHRPQQVTLLCRHDDPSFPFKNAPVRAFWASGSIRAGRGFRRRPVLRHQDRLDFRQMAAHGIPGACGVASLQRVEDTDVACQSRPLVLRQPGAPAQALRRSARRCCPRAAPPPKPAPYCRSQPRCGYGTAGPPPEHRPQHRCRPASYQAFPRSPPARRHACIRPRRRPPPARSAAAPRPVRTGWGRYPAARTA